MVSNWILKLWSFCALMDYTCSKDSNDLLFVNFRVTDQKIWILQDLNKIWFLNSILISIWFGDRHVAWSDRAIPVRVDRQWGAWDFKRIGRPRSTDTSSLKWFDLNHKIQIGWSKTEERGAHRIRLGFRRGSSEVAARRWSLVTFQGLPKLEDGWTACRTLRQTRLREPRRQSCPEKEEKGGWNSALAQVTFGHGRMRCSAADTTKKTSQGGAPEENKREGRK
jgi:hypothetical protein